MWNRPSGKSTDSEDNLPPQSSRRNDDEQRNPTYRNGSIASAPSATSHKESSSSANHQDRRGLKITSTSSSSNTRDQRPGAALAPTASSFATVPGSSYGEPYMAPDIVKDVSLANQMPKSGSSRSSRDQDRAREIRGERRSKTETFGRRDQDIERRQKRDKWDKKEKSVKRSEGGLNDDSGKSRGPDDFPDQVASSGFSQFPGQYEEAISGPNSITQEHPSMSSHVQDQFPGQFPIHSSAPYRPPLAASEGGPGLAAEYYGDAGQSVAEQPGNRTNTPSLIIGAEPHLQPALAVAAPPPEPSASGAVGAAASFFSGEFEGDETASTHSPQLSSTQVTGQIRPNSNYHSASAPIIPTVSGTVIESAAGYLIGTQTSSHQQHPDPEPSVGGAHSAYSSVANHRPPSEMQDSHYSSINQPSKPGKETSQPFTNPSYAAGIAGAAGLAAAAYEHSHHSANQNLSSTSQHSMTSMAQRRRNRGPLNSLMDFFKDPEGVAQFEEYSQIIGVCRHCFAPGSSPMDAPRKHHYRRRRSNEKYGSSTRVDKDNRYHSSENEGRRKNKSWLTIGLAGYGLAKVGESLFKDNDDSDDNLNVNTGRFPPDTRDRRSRHRSTLRERVELGITDDGKSDRTRTHSTISNGMETMKHKTRLQSKTRSESTDRKSGLTEAAFVTALGTSVVAASSRRRSRSPRRVSGKSKHMSKAPSPDRRHKSKKKKSDWGFFSFGSGSSSSSSVDLTYTSSQNKDRNSKRPTGKSKDDKKAEAALLGLGAAAAALSLNDGRQRRRKKSVRELVGVKEPKDHDRHGSTQTHRSKKSSGNLDDELWESAAEDKYESMNSDLAYGAPGRRDSRASISSESSGTSKWSWRWGSKKNRRGSSPRRKFPDHSNFPAAAGVDLSDAALASLDQRHDSAMTSASSLPLQHVYPVPTSDPSRFDVRSVGPIASPNRPSISSRPEAVPLQHPQPIAPVSTKIYSSQTAYDHSYSAPTGVAAFSQTSHRRYPETSGTGHSTREASIPGSFPEFEQKANDTVRNSKVRRRDTFPARNERDSMLNTVVPQRLTSVREDTFAVRFDLTEEQEERDRRERRWKRKQDKERREAEEQEQVEKDRRAPKKSSIEKRGSKTQRDYGSEILEKSWVAPVAAGIVGATIGSAAATERSRSEETREERRERRRREREREDEEEALYKSERRRRQRERDEQEAAIKEREKFPDETSPPSEYVDYQEKSLKRQDMSVWQEAASAKRSSSHENYGAFFTPLELLNKSGDQVKITSANADADIDLKQVPQIVTVEPKRIHDLSDSPAFSFADTDDKIDLSKPSFPWQVPRLRLVEPTPPSTRGSTPVLQPRDASDDGFDGSQTDRSPSKVKWVDEQNHGYTIIAPQEDGDEPIEQSSGKISDTDLASTRSTHERELSGDGTRPHADSATKSSSASYDDDIGFAATLAASAEDAGFDPSIVINNPSYRRRDSPPGSNERSMPGGFDDEDEQLSKRKERKRKEIVSLPQSKNHGPNGRDDDAIVQDILSQVESPEPQSSDQVASENLDDDWESIKTTEHTEPKKGQKTSESREILLETSKSGSEALDSENRDVYESPSEDVHPIALISNRAKNGRESQKDLIRNTSDFDDATSTMSSPSTAKASKDPKPKSKDKRKGSIWDRVLGKSTHSLPQKGGAKDVTEEPIKEGLEKPEKRTRLSKDRSSSRHRDDDQDSNERNAARETTPALIDISSQDRSVKGRRTSLPGTFSDAGPVAQYLDHGVEPEQLEEKQPESFLGMRPEPPPPPDTRAGSEEFSSSLVTTSLPTSPRTESEIKSRRFSDAGIAHPGQTTAILPSSPTAIPFHFRQPGRSSSSARSLSQTVPSSYTQSAAHIIPKQKTRPRSTEFKSSKEIRPLWLVERHRSHQEPAPDEVYPSLPSSHTTSRTSSIHDLEEGEDHQRRDHQLNGTKHKPTGVELPPTDPTECHAMRSDPLDSQQATLSASFFQDSRIVQSMPSPQASEDGFPKAIVKQKPPRSSSILKDGLLGTILGGSAAVALNETTQDNDPSQLNVSHEENGKLEHDLDDTGLDTVTHPSYNDTLDQAEEFFPQKAKKGKKNKRKPGQNRQEIAQDSVAGAAEAAEAKPNTKAVGPEPLSPGSIRQIQEQDAQDAVDSWSPSVRPSNKAKKGKKGKGKAAVERLPQENEPSPSVHEPSRDNLETAVSVEAQGNDSIAREMSRMQVVNIMAAVPQGVNKNEHEVSQSATVAGKESPEVQAEEYRSEPKAKKINEGDEGLLEDDFEQESLPKMILPPNDLPPDQTPQDYLQTETSPQDELPQKNIPQGDLPMDHPQHDRLPQLEVQPKIYPQNHPTPVNPPRDNLPQPQGLNLGGNPQPDSFPVLSSSSACKTGTFVDPFSEQGHTNRSESPKADSASKAIDDADPIIATSPQNELSQKALPFPHGIERRAETLNPIPWGQYGDDEKKPAAESPLDVPWIQDLSVVTHKSQERSQVLPSQAEQADEKNNFAAPSKKKPKRGKEAKESPPVDDNETHEIRGKDELLPSFIASTTLGDDQPKAFGDEPAIETPREKSEPAADESETFTDKRGGKKKSEAEESFSAENSKTNKIQKGREALSHMPMSELLGDPEAVRLIDKSAVYDSQPRAEHLKDEWTGLNDEEESETERQVTPNFSFGENKIAARIEQEMESLSETAAPKALEYRETIDLVGGRALHVANPQLVEEEPRNLTAEPTIQAPKSDVLEHELAGSDSSKTGKRDEKQTPEESRLGPEMDEIEHQSERLTDARDDVNDHGSSLAITQTSQEVSAMLDLNRVEASVGRESTEAFVNESQAEHNLQKPSESHNFHGEERVLPVLLEPGTPQVEDTPGKAHNEVRSPTLDTTAADTDTAQFEQEILAGGNNAECATYAKSEAVAVFTGMEETNFDTPVKEDTLDGGAPKKKKKGKKGKKSEALSWSEPEIIESTEPSGPPDPMNTAPEEESEADEPLEEDGLVRDARKKKRKGKKSKKSEAFAWDEPETIESAEASGPPGAMNTALEQEPATDKLTEEEELNRDAPKKKKKGKKGNRNKVFSLDEPEIVELGEFSGLPPATEPSPLEQEPATMANEEVPSGQPKKDKKNKKGKKKGASRAMSDFRDDDEPSVIPTEDPYEKDKAEDLDAISNDLAEGSEPIVNINKVSQSDQKAEDVHAIACDSDNGVEPCFVPNEGPRNDYQVEDRSAVEHQSVTSNVREGFEPNPIEAAPNNDFVEDLPMGGIPPMMPEIDAPREELEAVLPTTVVAQDDKISQEVPQKEEQKLMPAKSKKEKKKSKKSKKFNAFSLDDDDTPTLGDSQVAGTKDLEKDEPEHIIPPSIDVLENSEKTVPKMTLEQEEYFKLPAKKKDKKKSKRFDALSLNDDEIPTFGDYPTAGTENLEKDESEQMGSPSVEIVGEAATTVPKTQSEQIDDFMIPAKKDKKDKKKPKIFSPDDEKIATIQRAGAMSLENGKSEPTVPPSVNVVEEFEKAVPEIGLEQEEDYMVPAKRKSKKESKNSNAFPQDKDVDEPASKTKTLEEEAPKQIDPFSVGGVNEPRSEVENLLEENKDREETEKTRPLEWKSDGFTAPSEPAAAQALNKDPETDGKINTIDVSGDPGVSGGKPEEAVDGDFDTTSADAAMQVISHKSTSSVTSSLEPPASALEDATAYRANESESNVVPAPETSVDSLFGLRPSKKENKRAKKARTLTWEEDEVSQGLRAVSESSAAEDAIIPISQTNEFWSKPGINAQQVEPTGIFQPKMRPEEDQRHEGSAMEAASSQARDDAYIMVEDGHEDSFVNVENGGIGERAKSEKLSTPKLEMDRSPANMKKPVWATADSLGRGNEQKSGEEPRSDGTTAEITRSSQEQPSVGLINEQAPFLTEPEMIDVTKDRGVPWDVPVQLAGKIEGQNDEAQPDEPKLENLSSSAAPEPAQETMEKVQKMDPVVDVEPFRSPFKDETIRVVEVETLDAQEQHDYNKEYTTELERAVRDKESIAETEPPGGSHIDKPAPALEVELLDAQEQRDYNEEYAKELERQLSPPHGGERADFSLDEANTFGSSPLSISSVIERPYEEEHRPFAQPPTLEDIIEEPRSRSGSVQGNPIDRDDKNFLFKPAKKGKKGKKGRKQQPVIWEDETATPLLGPESDQGAKPSVRFSEGTGSLISDVAQKSPNDQSFEHCTTASPTGDPNTTHNKFALVDDRSGDYFTIQPSEPAEENVGREDTEEFRRALATEQLYTGGDQSSARESQADLDDKLRDDGLKAYNQDEEPARLAKEHQVKSGTKAEPNDDMVVDDFDLAHLNSDSMDTMAQKKAPPRERESQTLGREGVMDQSRDFKIPTADTLNETSPSHQHVLQSHSNEDERSSVAEGISSSQDDSGRIEGVTAAIGLGVAALAAESLSHRKSEKKRRGRKEKEASRWADFEAGADEAQKPHESLDRQEAAFGDKEYRQTPVSESAIRAWQQYQATPSRSPSPAIHKAVADHAEVGKPGQSSETPEYRDSAIHVSGSPMTTEEIPYHRAVRDSGYPDTEASPTIRNEFEILDTPTESERDIAANERVGHVQRQHSRAHEDNERQRPTSRNPIEISIEANSDFNVSVSRPREKQTLLRRRSGTAYDSDDSADSGFDVQRRRRRQAMAAEPREPSPVSSTTKDRSSALFDSSPSAGEVISKPHRQDGILDYDPAGEKPTWSFDREGSPDQRSRETSREDVSGDIPEGAVGSISFSMITGHHGESGRSLFGGPQTHDDDLLSPSRSPPLSESRGRRRLNSISEDSADADGSLLNKKDKRALSDVGSPESGVKGRRMRSPPSQASQDDAAGEDGFIHNPMSRQPWPTADDQEGAIDERSRSRNPDQLSTLSSRHSHSVRPGQPGARFGQREEEKEDKEAVFRSTSAGSMQSKNTQSEKSIHAIIRTLTPDQVRSASGLSYRSSAAGAATPPLRRVDRSASGDLRAASKKDEAKNYAKNQANSGPQLEAELDIGIPSSSTYDPVIDKGKSRADMVDVYEGWGDVRGQSPMSPTRPPSMRKRQSMQLLDLETRLDQIVSENRLLASQKLTAEKALHEQARDHSQQRHAYEEAMQEHKMYLTRKDSELNELKTIIEQLHQHAAHLAEVNGELTSSRGADEEHEQAYNQLQAEHAHTHEQWQQSTRELENLKEQHTQLSTGMEDIVRHEVTVALEEKNIELRQLQGELENAKQQVRNLQQQLLASRSRDDFVERDEDYFDSRCQSLCQHVQQWVLRFSKFSDMKACYLAREVHDEKVVDRMENAILDGSDVDDYLSDRVKRRDVFMSVVMTMIWEFIFTRYLFGMDREQRQKLKSLEKTLQEVGPISAVHRWRATTLTLLMKRDTFENQRATDTEAVVHEIYDTLATFLPPPSHLVAQIQESLRKVIDAAVDLSIEMRTQRAEYSMLPPLQPEYDTNGDLARKVYFSALTMNERSGATSSNEALQEQHAVVRMVLFPLVVKNEDDDEQIVVCPAQVLTAEGSKGMKTVRILSAQGMRSEASFVGSDVRMEGGMI